MEAYMGHTLVTRLNKHDLALIQATVLKTGIPANKIPFGRGCDREAADRVLPYHITFFHWGKKDDETYLRRLKGYKAPGTCVLAITGSTILPGAEGSVVLCFTISPDKNYLVQAAELERILQGKTSASLHMTLAVSQDHREIRLLKRKIDEALMYPLLIRVEGYDLYHIWRPVKKVAEF